MRELGRDSAGKDAFGQPTEHHRAQKGHPLTNFLWPMTCPGVQVKFLKPVAARTRVQPEGYALVPEIEPLVPGCTAGKKLDVRSLVRDDGINVGDSPRDSPSRVKCAMGAPYERYLHGSRMFWSAPTERRCLYETFP